MNYILWQWQNPSAAPNVTYNLYVGSAPGSEALLQSGIVGTSFQQPSPAPGTYYGYVTAVEGGAEGARSAEASVSVPAPNVPTPSLQGFGVLVQNEPVNLLRGM